MNIVLGTVQKLPGSPDRMNTRTEVEASNVQAVLEIMEAFGARDADRMMCHMHQDAVHHEPEGGIRPVQGSYCGVDAIREFYRRLNGSLDIHSFAVDRVLAEGDIVVSLGGYSATVRATNRSYSTNFAMVWKFLDCKVKELTVIKDSAAEAVAMGLH